jgi:hypothetical protein
MFEAIFQHVHGESIAGFDAGLMVKDVGECRFQSKAFRGFCAEGRLKYQQPSGYANNRWVEIMPEHSEKVWVTCSTWSAHRDPCWRVGKQRNQNIDMCPQILLSRLEFRTVNVGSKYGSAEL